MTPTKTISAPHAAALIPDGAVVTVSSSSGLGCPDLVLKAIGERFAQVGRPRNLTTLHPIAAGDMSGVKGIDHIARAGLLSRVIAGSYPSGPSTSEPPLIWQMIGANEVAAYNVPSGIMFDMMREAALTHTTPDGVKALEHSNTASRHGMCCSSLDSFYFATTRLTTTINPITNNKPAAKPTPSTCKGVMWDKSS